MTSYIFLTSEGYTFQPDSESALPDIENLQVIGIAQGGTADDAFFDLVSNFPYLKETAFDEVFCYELAQDYEHTRSEFRLKVTE
jgi:hypothetical protein